LNRFFSIHFVLPFLIAGLTLIHLALLHKVGSNSPIGSDTGIDDSAWVMKSLFYLCERHKNEKYNQNELFIDIWYSLIFFFIIIKMMLKKFRLDGSQLTIGENSK